MVIALTGEKLAGKGTVAKHLAERHQARVLRFSQPLSDVLTRLHQPNTRTHLVQLGSKLREVFGDDILARVVKEDILTAPHNFWVVDGMRYMTEYDILSQLPDFYLLNITAPLEVRWHRTKQRGEKADEATMTLAEFTAREQDVTEQQIAAVQGKATQTIHNTGSFNELYSVIDQWLQSQRH